MINDPRHSILLWTMALCLSGQSVSAQGRCDLAPSPKAAAIVDEINTLRKDPARYAERLRDLRPSYEGKRRKLDESTSLATKEGWRAVADAIDDLLRTEPLPPLAWDACLAQAARDHVADRGPRGGLGHDSSAGVNVMGRVRRYRKNVGMVGENISYGPSAPKDIVMQLVIDDGVPDRGHRRNFLRPEFRKVGLACGPHATLRTMCVIDFSAHPSRIKLPTVQPPA